MQPVNIDLPDHTRKDTWEKITIGPILFNELQPTYALSSCRWYFRTKKKVLGFKLVNSPDAQKPEEEGEITILSPTTWTVEIPAQVLPLKAGDWYWDFETIDADGVVRTLYSGVLKITQDKTYDSN